MKVNARTTRPIVRAGSITRRSGFFIFFRSIPSRNGMMARFAPPATSRPMLSRTTTVAPNSAIGRFLTAAPSSRIMRNGTETRYAAWLILRKIFWIPPSWRLQTLTTTLSWTFTRPRFSRIGFGQDIRLRVLGVVERRTASSCSDGIRSSVIGARRTWLMPPP